MKTNDLLIISTVAVGTAALTILTLWPSTLDAGNDAGVQAPIAKPRLLSSGVEMTLATADGKVPKAGDVPVLELTAVSFTNVSTWICARVTMNTSSPADIFSRTVRMPTVLWTDNQEFTVLPGETKRIKLVCGKSLPANKLISVALQDIREVGTGPVNTSLPVLSGAGSAQPAGHAMVALSFSTGATPNAPALVIAR